MIWLIVSSLVKEASMQPTSFLKPDNSSKKYSLSTTKCFESVQRNSYVSHTQRKKGYFSVVIVNIGFSTFTFKQRLNYSLFRNLHTKKYSKTVCISEKTIFKTGEQHNLNIGNLTKHQRTWGFKLEQTLATFS